MNKPWDGKAKGNNSICQEGVYTWMVIFNDLEANRIPIQE